MAQAITSLRKYAGSFKAIAGQKYLGSGFPVGTIMQVKTKNVRASVNGGPMFSISFDDETLVDPSYYYTFESTCIVATLSTSLDLPSDTAPIVSNITTNAAYGAGNYLISADATSGAIEVILPSATVGYGYTYTITKSDISANVVTITSASLIAGQAFIELTSKFEALTVFSNGVEWRLS